MRFVLVVILAVELLGCSYADEKALRDYDNQLAPIRLLITELSHYQSRVVDKTSADKMRTFVMEDIVSRAARIVGRLAIIETQDPKIQELNLALITIWKDYELSFEEFAEDLTSANLDRKKIRMNVALERCDVRWKSWNAELLAYHEAVSSWAH